MRNHLACCVHFASNRYIVVIFKSKQTYWNKSDLIGYQGGIMSLELGRRIAEGIKRNNMTQRELAEKIFVAEASMSRYIKGEREPKPDVLADIARELNTSVDYLLGMETAGYNHLQILQIITENARHMTNMQKRDIVLALLDE